MPQHTREEKLRRAVEQRLGRSVGIAELRSMRAQATGTRGVRQDSGLPILDEARDAIRRQQFEGEPEAAEAPITEEERFAERGEATKKLTPIERIVKAITDVEDLNDPAVRRFLLRGIRDIVPTKERTKLLAEQFPAARLGEQVAVRSQELEEDIRESGIPGLTLPGLGGVTIGDISDVGKQLTRLLAGETPEEKQIKEIIQTFADRQGVTFEEARRNLLEPVDPGVTRLPDEEDFPGAKTGAQFAVRTRFTQLARALKGRGTITLSSGAKIRVTEDGAIKEVRG